MSSCVSIKTQKYNRSRGNYKCKIYWYWATTFGYLIVTMHGITIDKLSENIRN